MKARLPITLAATAATEHALSDLARPPAPAPVPSLKKDPRWRDLGVRTASGTVLALIGLLTMWVGGLLWAGTICLLGLGMAVEWAGLCAGRAGRLLALGALYIAPAIASLIWLRAEPNGHRWVLLLAAVVWGGDVGAYLVGRLIGGPRLAPSISPGKTWSGAIGGTLIAVLAGMAAWPERLALVAPVALLLSITAQAGDLLESAIKRRFGVKDSGRLIPGHGGLLDRLDGVLTSAPVAAIVLLVFGP